VVVLVISQVVVDTCLISGALCYVCSDHATKNCYTCSLSVSDCLHIDGNVLFHWCGFGCTTNIDPLSDTRGDFVHVLFSLAFF